MPKAKRRAAKSPPLSAFDDACRSLARSRQTEKQIRRKLARRHSIDSIDEAVAKLKEYKVIDDEALIIDYTSDRLTYSPRSAELIAEELRRKGIDREDFRRVFAREFPDYDELETARRALQQTIAVLKKTEAQKRRERALRFLHSRGFSYDVMVEVWEGVVNEINFRE